MQEYSQRGKLIKKAWCVEALEGERGNSEEKGGDDSAEDMPTLQGAGNRENAQRRGMGEHILTQHLAKFDLIQKLQE